MWKEAFGYVPDLILIRVIRIHLQTTKHTQGIRVRKNGMQETLYVLTVCWAFKKMKVRHSGSIFWWLFLWSAVAF